MVPFGVLIEGALLSTLGAFAIGIAVVRALSEFLFR